MACRTEADLVGGRAAPSPFGSSPPPCLPAPGTASPRSAAAIGEEREQELRDEVIGDQDQDARRHDRSRSALPHALGSTGGSETEITCRDRDDGAEDKRLRQTLNEVVRQIAPGKTVGGELLPHGAPVLTRGQAGV